MPLASVKLAGGADVTVVWARTAPAERTLVEISAARRRAADREEDIMILMRDRARMSGSEGTASYTVRLRLRVTKQRIQRVRKLMISNLPATAGTHKRPAPGSRRVRMSRGTGALLFLVLAGHDVEMGLPRLVRSGAIGIVRRRRLIAG